MVHPLPEFMSLIMKQNSHYVIEAAYKWSKWRSSTAIKWKRNVNTIFTFISRSKHQSGSCRKWKRKWGEREKRYVGIVLKKVQCWRKPVLLWLLYLIIVYMQQWICIFFIQLRDGKWTYLQSLHVIILTWGAFVRMA